MNTPTHLSRPPRPRIKDKRAAILRAALEVFAEGGVNGVPIPVLADRAGVGTGTIYRYFASKDALVNELFREQRIALAKRLFVDLSPNAGPYELFVEVWQRMFDFARQDPDAYRFLELQDHRPYLDDASRSLDSKLLRNIVMTYHGFQVQGVFRKDIRPEILLSLVWGSFVNLIRSERDGYLALSQADIDSAGEACWSLCTG